MIALGLAAFVAWLVWEILTPRSALKSEAVVGSATPVRALMATLAWLGLAAFAFAVARLADRRTAVYTAIILATMPAWFVHGRTATLLMVPLAATAMVFAGLALALLDARASTGLRTVATAGALVGALLGSHAHALVATAVPPAMAIGIAAWSSRSHGSRRAGLVVFGIGGALVVVGLRSVMQASDGTVANVLVGIRATTSSSTTFDAAVAPLAYGLLPWSPFVAVALGRRPRTAIHLAALVAAVVGLMLHAVLTMRTAPTVLVGVAPIATCVGFAIAGVDRMNERASEQPGSLLPLILLSLGGLVAHDIGLEPGRILLALDVRATSLHQVSAAAQVVRYATWLTTALAALAVMVPQRWLLVPRSSALLTSGALGGLLLRGYAYPILLMLEVP
jgi:hypothetical protein